MNAPLKEPDASDSSLVRARATGGARWLGEIALQDWRLAGTLLKASKMQGSQYGLGHGQIITAATAWTIYNLKARWESTTADKQVKAQITGTVETDTWIRRVTYTVRRPNFAAGSIWKAQSDYFNRLNPNIDVEQFLVKGFCNYFISPEATPLENIEAVFECVCPAGLVLTCDASIMAFFRNLRAFTSDEVPVEVIISLHGTRLPKGLYTNCDYADVYAALLEADVFAPRDLGPVCGP